MKIVRETVLSTLLPLGVVGAIAAVVSARTAVSFWAAFAMGVAAILANGLLATLEDDLPGGFNNPDGTSTPKYAIVVTKIVRWASAGLCVALAVVSVLSAFQYSQQADRLIGSGIAALLVGAAFLMIRRRREAIVTTALGVLAVLVAMFLR